MAEHIDAYALTLREIEALRRIAEGSSNKIAAGHWGISEDTVIKRGFLGR
jgi:DNA-binding CsgD family transcriptional regulator